jgi:hypothetical protein
MDDMGLSRFLAEKLDNSPQHANQVPPGGRQNGRFLKITGVDSPHGSAFPENVQTGFSCPVKGMPLPTQSVYLAYPLQVVQSIPLE